MKDNKETADFDIFVTQTMAHLSATVAMQWPYNGLSATVAMQFCTGDWN